GARQSGKTYLISKQTELPVFKFDFNSNFSTWNFGKQSEETHWFGLGKEVMLHELDYYGFLDKMIVDRGILTNSVWGVFQGRVTKAQAEKDLINFDKRGLFKNTRIILIEGQSKENRVKDIWDQEDSRSGEERALFYDFSLLLKRLGVNIKIFNNNFDLESVVRFKQEIRKN
ncbi:MAG: hypothetical protein EBS19_01455, partial [Spirochaetia bacterium]|nr:hypothetical protein [Spirochaetia bacterium]